MPQQPSDLRPQTFSPPARFALLLPAAGAGQRFTAAHHDPAGKKPPAKIEVDLDGKPVFLRAIEAFRHRPDVVQTLLAVHPDHAESFRFKWGDKLAFSGVTVIPGGRRERWETVSLMLEHLDAEVTHVAVHDAARPLPAGGEAFIDRVFAAALKFPAVIPGYPVANTLKKAATFDEDNAPAPDPLDAILPPEKPTPTTTIRRVVSTVDRRDVVEVQTPQVFEVSLLRRAYEQIASGRLDPAAVTDDAMLVEALGEPVRVVEGDPFNVKITRPDDVKLAAALLAYSKPSAAATVARKRLFADEEE